jgi:hypothetical protein
MPLFTSGAQVTPGRRWIEQAQKVWKHTPVVHGVLRAVRDPCGRPSVFSLLVNGALRNAVLLLFSIPGPSMELTSDRERDLQARFAAEVDLARRLTGQPLPSLGL